MHLVQFVLIRQTINAHKLFLRLYIFYFRFTLVMMMLCFYRHYDKHLLLITEKN